MGSTSSAIQASSDDEVDGNRYVFPRADDTEVELHRRRRRGSAPDAMGGAEAKGGALGSGPDHTQAAALPAPPRQPHNRVVPADVAAHPLPVKVTLLPFTFKAGPVRFTINRKRAEDSLLLGAVVLGISLLAYRWNEWALAGELSTLLILSAAYLVFRVQPLQPAAPISQRPRSPALTNIRDRSGRRASSNNGTLVPGHAHAPIAEDRPAVGGRGCVWGTEEREYRDCLDDGALFALLLSPVVAAALLHAALTRLASEPDSATLPGWFIDKPILIASTPIRRISSDIPRGTGDVVRTLSALAIARRNLVQLFTLLSFVLLVQLTWSLRHEVILGRNAPTSPPSLLTALPNASTGAKSALHVPAQAPKANSAHGSEPESEVAPPQPGTFWLKRGELKRNMSVIGFAFIVTGGCVIVKIATAYVEHGVWSDMSHSDIVIATLFYQFCLYVCVRLARRGFTLGELGIVTHAATALFMEVVNMTRLKIPIFQTPYTKTYRLPTGLLIFQLALIPGSLLTGFLLSPLLYLSRHLAQRPARRLRFPHEKPMHRRLLALGFYAGALLVVVGVVGTWAHWCLGKNPWVWVFWFLLKGKHAWTRPALIGYWGALALFSVAAWQRQLSRARRHRRYVVPGARESTSPTTSTSNVASTFHTPSTGPDTISGVATQMMDAADMRIPTLSVNARRKSFHALAVAMFIPGIAVDPAFTHLSFSVAFAAFTFAEYVRYFALWPLGASVHLFLNEFIDHKDSGTAILSHFYLLAGCACPLWLEGNSQILAHFGVLALGVGDAVASIVGRRMGYIRWSPASGKTVEGSVGFLVSVVAAAGALWLVGIVEPFNLSAFIFATAATVLLEAWSAQNDNLMLPVYGWAVGTLLGV